MALQATISAGRLRRKIGRTLTVLVDAIDEEGTAIARSSADAPEIDGVVYIENGEDLPVGEFVPVRIVESDEHDLFGERLLLTTRRWNFLSLREMAMVLSLNSP